MSQSTHLEKLKKKSSSHSLHYCLGWSRQRCTLQSINRGVQALPFRKVPHHEQPRWVKPQPEDWIFLPLLPQISSTSSKFQLQSTKSQIPHKVQQIPFQLLTPLTANFNLISFRYFTYMYLFIYSKFFPPQTSLCWRVTNVTKQICPEIICKFMMWKMWNNSQ